MLRLWTLALALLLAPSSTAIRIDVSRRAFASGLAAAATSATLPAFAERNVMTKQEAAEAQASMIKRSDTAGEETEESLANQEARRARRQLILEKKATFEAKVAACETAAAGKKPSREAWVGASNDLVEYLKLEALKPDPVSHPPGKSVPEGVKIKDVVKRLRASYNALPTDRINCGKDVRPDVKCYSPGKEVETAYNNLIAELRRNSPCATQDCKGSATEAF